MGMPVSSIVILRQHWIHLSAARSLLTPPEVLQVDRLCRLITQTVKDESSAFIISSYPLLSAIKALSAVMERRRG